MSSLLTFGWGIRFYLRHYTFCRWYIDYDDLITDDLIVTDKCWSLFMEYRSNAWYIFRLRYKLLIEALFFFSEWYHVLRTSLLYKISHTLRGQSICLSSLSLGLFVNRSVLVSITAKRDGQHRYFGWICCIYKHVDPSIAGKSGLFKRECAEPSGSGQNRRTARRLKITLNISDNELMGRMWVLYYY